MKFYTLAYDCNRPTKQQINVPTNSDFKVGVKIFRNDEEQMLEPTEVTLGNLSADPEKLNDYVTFTQATGDEAKMEISQLSIDHTPLASDVASLIKRATTINVGLYLSANAELIGKTISPRDILYKFVEGNSEASVQAELDAMPFSSFSLQAPHTVGTMRIASKAGDVYDQSRWLYLPSIGWDTTFRASTEAEKQAACVNPEDLPPPGVDYFLGVVPIDEQTNKFKIELNYTLKEDDYFIFQPIQTGPRTYRGVELKIQLGQPLNANFDLAVNTFKSQQGDIDIVGDTSGFYTKGEVDAMLSAKADVADLTSKVTNLSSVSGIMKISQADYDALSAGGTADVNTLYVIVD